MGRMQSRRRATVFTTVLPRFILDLAATRWRGVFAAGTAEITTNAIDIGPSSVMLRSICGV